jgi:predicted aspartyl protease
VDRNRGGVSGRSAGSGTGRGLLFLLLAAACATNPSVSIEPFVGAVVPGKVITAFNVEAELARGRYLEVSRYLQNLPDSERGESSNLVLAGRVWLARGDAAAAGKALEAALSGSIAGGRRADAEWALSQARILADDFREAAHHASLAVRAGLYLSPGFVRFLESLSGSELYSGLSPAESVVTGFTMGPYDLIRVPVGINGRPSDAVLDTGASYSIVTRSFAHLAGVREIADSEAYGLGLHQKPIPLTFGVVDELTIGDARLTSVPVMIMPDDALHFETARGPLPISSVLGLHLLKDFTLDIDYIGRRLTLERHAGPGPGSDTEQNLFFARNKVMARVTVNESPWTLFLLDTGSELTMMTTAGVRRLGVRTASGIFPKRVEGIGKARVSWGKVEDVSIGLASYRLRFRDMVVAETDDTIEDGVVGSSALARFRARIDFRHMRLELEARTAPAP